MKDAKNSAGKGRLKLLSRDLQLTDIGPDARRQAAVVLEVLSGLRTPEQAAQMLSVSLPTYFHLETRALHGLIWACSPQGPGRQPSLGPKLREAQAQVQQLEQQVQRYRALLRTAQRGLGLSPPTEAKDAKGKRKAKKPSVRALRAVKLLQSNDASKDPNSPGAPAAEALSSPGANGG